MFKLWLTLGGYIRYKGPTLSSVHLNTWQATKSNIIYFCFKILEIVGVGSTEDLKELTAFHNVSL
jgi:hypothetical protein